jgi:hypothetical protein
MQPDAFARYRRLACSLRAALLTVRLSGCGGGRPHAHETGLDEAGCAGAVHSASSATIGVAAPRCSRR